MDDHVLLDLVNRAMINVLFTFDVANTQDCQNILTHAHRQINNDEDETRTFWVDLRENESKNATETLEAVRNDIELSGGNVGDYQIVTQANQQDHPSIVFLHKLFKLFHDIEENVFDITYTDIPAQPEIPPQTTQLGNMRIEEGGMAAQPARRTCEEVKIKEILTEYNKELKDFLCLRTEGNVSSFAEFHELSTHGDLVTTPSEFPGNEIVEKTKKKLLPYLEGRIELLKEIQRKIAGFTDFLASSHQDNAEEKRRNLTEIFGPHADVVFERYCRSDAQINLVTARPMVDVLYQYAHFLNEKVNMLEMHCEIFKGMGRLRTRDVYQFYVDEDEEDRSSIAQSIESATSWRRQFSWARNDLNLFYQTILPIIKSNYFSSQHRFYETLSNPYYQFRMPSENFAWRLLLSERVNPGGNNQLDETLMSSESRPFMLRDQLTNYRTLYLDFFHSSEILRSSVAGNEDVYDLYNEFFTFGWAKYSVMFCKAYDRDMFKFLADHPDFLQDVGLIDGYSEVIVRIPSGDGDASIENSASNYWSALTYWRNNPPEYDSNDGDLRQNLTSRLLGIGKPEEILSLPKMNNNEEDRSDDNTENLPGGNGGSGINNSSNLTIQDFPGKLNSDVKYMPAFQTYEEYLEHMLQEAHKKMLQDANDKFQKELSKKGKAQLPHIADIHRYKNTMHEDLIYAQKLRAGNLLTRNIFSASTLSFFSLLASAQHQPQILSMHDYQVKQNYRMAVGGYGGGTSSQRPFSNFYGNSKPGNMLHLSNYQSSSKRQKFVSFLRSNISTGERVAYGLAGLKMGYFIAQCIRSLILNANGKEAPLTNRQAMEGLATVGFWAALCTTLVKFSSKLPKEMANILGRTAGVASLAWMTKDLIQFGRGQLTSLLMKHYGLTEESKIPYRHDPKLQTLVQLQQALEKFQKDPSEKNRLNVILATNIFIQPVLTQTQVFMQLNDNKFIELSPRRYRHDQEHYRNGEHVLSVPQIFSSTFNQNQAKPQGKKNIRFDSMRLVCKCGETIFNKAYIGPQGELYDHFALQSEAWSNYEKDKKDLYPNISATSTNLENVSSVSTNYHIVLNVMDNTVKVMNETFKYEVGKLIERNGELRFVTIGDMVSFNSISLKRFVEIGRQQTPKVQPIIVQSTPAILNRVFQSHKRFGLSLLPEIKSFTQTLYKNGSVDKAFYKMVKNTPSSEGYKIITFINLLAQHGKGLMTSPLFKYSQDKSLVEKTTKQYMKIFWADYFYNHLDMKKAAKLKNTSQMPVIQNPYDVVFGS